MEKLPNGGRRPRETNRRLVRLAVRPTRRDERPRGNARVLSRTVDTTAGPSLDVSVRLSDPTARSATRSIANELREDVHETTTRAMLEDDPSDDPENPYPPGTDGPRVDIPSVDIPSVEPSTDELGDSKLTSLFLLHVILWNAVLLLVSLGTMLIYFRGDTATGGQLLAAGVVLTAYGLYRLPD